MAGGRWLLGTGPAMAGARRLLTAGLAMTCRRLLAAGLTAVLLGGCGGAAGTERPRPTRGDPFPRPLDIYRDLGFATGSGQFPAVASFSTIAGPADSTYVLLGMSLPNSALRFQRAETGFLAEYDLEIALLDADSATVRRSATRESVRVSTFAETGRTDESVVFQHAFAAVPGRYIVEVRASDRHSSRGFRMTDTLIVPAYGVGGVRLSTPMLVYEARGRDNRADLPGLIMNPRHTVPYGGVDPVVYLEAYGAGAPVSVAVLDDGGTVLWQTRVDFEGGTAEGGTAPVRYGVVPIPADLLPLGRLWVETATSESPTVRRPLVLTISDQWMVANFDEVLQILRYIAYSDEIDALRSGEPAERRAAWETFWARRDPLPISGINEFREQFFQRVRFATEAFREGGRAGWQTHRGEVYIVLGPPDAAMERFIGRTDGTGRPNAEEWIYTATSAGRLNLLFHDRGGFGRLELTPSSAAAFRHLAERLKPRRSRN
jgi:GWxTD domain-containing protein